MRHVHRTTPLIALARHGRVAGGVVGRLGLEASEAESSTGSTTAASTQAPTSAAGTTAANGPASCIRGNFRFTQMAYDGPVQTQFGPTVITGGIGGRRIELKRDNTFHFTDDGSDQVQFSLLGNPPTDGTAVLKAQSDGTFVPTEQTANFNITALSGTLLLTLQNGSIINIPLPPDGAGVKETFGLNGDATYTCQGNTVTFRFPALTIALERV